MGFLQYNEGQPFNAAAIFNNASGTAQVQIIATSTHGGRRIDQIIACSTDTVDRVVDVWFACANGVTTLLGSVTVPAGAGIAGVVAVDLIAHLPLTVYGGLPMQAGDALLLAMEVAVTAGKSIYFSTLGGSL